MEDDIEWLVNIGVYEVIGVLVFFVFGVFVYVF